MDEQTDTSSPPVNKESSQGARSQTSPSAPWPAKAPPTQEGGGQSLPPVPPQAAVSANRPPTQRQAQPQPQSPQQQPMVPTPTAVPAVPQAQPQPGVPPQAGQVAQQPVSLHYVGFGRRFVALLIDVIILVIVGTLLIGSLILASASGLQGPSEEELMGLNLIANLVMTIINWLYFVGFLAAKGATPGKMVLGIKIVTIDGAPVSLGRAALREIIGKIISAILLGLGYLWVIRDKKKQGWHDKIAGTVVVYSK